MEDAAPIPAPTPEANVMSGSGAASFPTDTFMTSFDPFKTHSMHINMTDILVLLQASSSLGPFKTGGCWKRVSNEPHCPWSPGWTNVLSCLAHAVPLPPHLILPMRNLTLLEIKCLLLVTWLPSDRTRIYVFWLAAECFFCSTLLPR